MGGGSVLGVGLIAAIVASVLFNVGIALQGIEARRAPKKLGLRVGLLGVLLRRPRWLLGLFLGFVGIAPQVAALAYAPFALVQPALLVGLLVLLFLGARTFGEPVGSREIGGVLAIVGGVALVAWGVPARAESHRGLFAVAAVVAALGIGALSPFPLKETRFSAGILSVVASGFGFAASNIATKLMSDDLGRANYASAGLWALVGLASGVVATITGMSAFQRCRATTVVPVSTAVQTFLPLLLEPFFLHESWGSAAYGGVPLLAGLIVALVGTLLVARSRAVTRVARAQAN